MNQGRGEEEGAGKGVGEGRREDVRGGEGGDAPGQEEAGWGGWLGHLGLWPPSP